MTTSLANQVRVDAGMAKSGVGGEAHFGVAKISRPECEVGVDEMCDGKDMSSKSCVVGTPPIDTKILPLALCSFLLGTFGSSPTSLP